MKTILLIEDNEAISGTLGMLIGYSGHSCEVYASPFDALSAVEDGLNYDSAIVDRSLGREDGSRVCRQLKGLCPNKPIVMLSGHRDPPAEDGDRLYLEKLGIDKFFLKPAKAEEILEFLEARME
jgi:DNA-binding response OmpR family regulator